MTKPSRQILPIILVAAAFFSYTVVFSSYRAQLGTGIASLATIPVVVAGWYFGINGGITIAFLTILSSGYFLAMGGDPLSAIFTDPGNILRIISLLLVAIVTGGLSNISHQRMELVRSLEQFEEQRRSHTSFLEFLYQITGMALEAEMLESTIQILVEHIAVLFEADDCYFASWDEATHTTIPVTAYGSQRDTYPQMRFKPGEQTLTASIMENGRPIAIPDTANSPFISPKIASLFSNKSMLGLPLIVQGRKLGALILGYADAHSFDPNEITRAEIAAEQMAVVLWKSQLLEDAHRQVVELSVIHDAALAAVQADSEDQLIERVTEIIRDNLFPDNFGVLLLDQKDAVLRAHPSYRFYSNGGMNVREISITEGVSGEVARTGLPRRISDVRATSQYVDVDPGTQSELCVPIMFKGQILGVINAESTKRDAFTADDERLMVTIAGQLATAMEQLRKARAERQWLDQLARTNDLIYALLNISTHIENTLDEEEIIKRLGIGLQKIDLTCIMAIHDPNRETFTINFTSMMPDHLEVVEKGLGYPMLHYTFPLGKLPKTMLQPAAISKPEAEIESLFTDTERPGVLRILGEIGVNPGMEPLRLPIIVEDNLLGILWIWGEGIRSSDLPILSIFAKQVGVSLERARLFQEVQNLAITDPLTGLHNRRSLYELGKIEFSRAERLNRPFSCLMLDLDHFKQINDNHGHPFGDIVLQEFARLCKESVREIDLVGRYGGEELLVLMPETELDRAVHVAERLRLNIAGHPISIAGTEIQVTTSIGVTTKDQNTLELDTLVARADQAMYIAKHRGRNRVAVSK